MGVVKHGFRRGDFLCFIGQFSSCSRFSSFFCDFLGVLSFCKGIFDSVATVSSVV